MVFFKRDHKGTEEKLGKVMLLITVMLPVLKNLFHFMLCSDMTKFSPIFTARQRSCGKVMFSQACVMLSKGGGIGLYPQDHYPPSSCSVEEQAVCILLECFTV